MDRIQDLIEQVSRVDSSAATFEEIKCKLYNERNGSLGHYDCDKCKNKGYIMITRNGDTLMQECECMPKRRSLKRIAESGISGLLRDCTMDSFSAKTEWQKEIKNAAERFIENHDGQWFYIGGQVGCGKTHICTAIVGAMLNIGMSARYMLWRDDVVRLKANVNDDLYGLEMDKLKRVKVLYIDDFFKTRTGDRPTQGDVNIAFELLNSRYSNKLPTIISCEKSVNEILDIDEAVGSRIYERSKEFCINVGRDQNKNWRLR